MTKSVDLTALPGLITLVEQQADTIPDLDWKNWTASQPEQDKAIAAAAAVLEAAGARLSQNSYAHAIRLAGFQATCTSSFTGALRNWCAAARRRLAS